ncbi:putative adenylyl cyclase CyaB [Vibrio ichthyoenteri ATCC 700023]|uniref:Putative adenylyl cyclase CyaB n=1 Tax=Vibrio ichthyoenteri ATCC 700023 TaxID=870968 RepID=F9RZU2_9VIBR|nr:class IV adenylate cyclase [Vibrio ichthyoenteri]EGU44350.1 putative adenylyl cyclase CyaB [Vibrio ichthyoenteri ATCC 700023]
MSHEHFKGKYEVELKYRVACPQDFHTALQHIEHEVMVFENAETDWYFDTPQQTLKAQNKTISIREMEPSGIKLWIVKGPEADRCEATNITNSIAAKSMLENMGYQVRVITQKIRSIYFVGAFHITFDYLPNIGHFAEFAIMTDDEAALDRYRDQLHKLAAKFGLNDQHLETHSYLALFEQLSTNKLQ